MIVCIFSSAGIGGAGRNGGIISSVKRDNYVNGLYYTYCIEYQSVCPFVGIGPPPQLPQASVSPPWTQKREEVVRGWWEGAIRTTGKPGTLCTLWTSTVDERVQRREF